MFDISESRSSLTGGLSFSHNEDIGRKGRKSTNSCIYSPQYCVKFQLVYKAH